MALLSVRTGHPLVFGHGCETTLVLIATFPLSKPGSWHLLAGISHAVQIAPPSSRFPLVSDFTRSRPDVCMHEKWRQMRVEVEGGKEGEANFDEGWRVRGGKARKET